MRKVAIAAAFLFVCPIALAQMLCHAVASPGGISPCAKNLATAVPQEAFEKAYWPAIMDSLKSSPGLPFFRQGLTQYYGLDYEEAMRNFKEAKKDPRLAAMASWGIALAAGPNINLNMTDACHCLAKKEIRRAACLAGVDATIDLCPGDVNANEACTAASSITQLEKDLIEALKQRYDYQVPEESKKHAEDYRDAMARIWTADPKDKNVSTLYAESMMNLNPWDLYDQDGFPKREETNTIVDVLKASVGDSIEAIGANHYYIHAVEGSNPYIGSIHPIDALRSANLLQKQVPESGHLVHMSSHIYLLLGKYQDSPQGPMINGYQKAVEVNIKGANNDVMQYSDACHGTYATYTSNDTCPQLYYGHYVSHNYFFGSVAATFLGQSKNAIALAVDTQAHVQRFMAYEPGLQRYLSAPLMTMVVNRNWEAICDKSCQEETTAPPSPTFDDCYSQGQGASGCYVVRAIWYWARGMARAAYGKDGNGELNAMVNEIGKIPPCSMETRSVINTFGNNCAKDVLDIGRWILKARITWAAGKPGSSALTLAYLNEAVALEDKLLYDEPPQWFTPAREALGGFYLQAAKERIDPLMYYYHAYVAFDDALLRHPGSGRAIYGQMRALQGIGSDYAKDAETAFHDAWASADYTMTDADLWPARKAAKQSDDGSPSRCYGSLPRWSRRAEGGKEVLLPPSDARDLRAGEVKGSNVTVNYALLECPKQP